MTNALHNRILNLTSEIEGCLESISNTRNGAGKVRECIDNTKTAQDDYLGKLKASIQKLAAVQLEAKALLVPLPPYQGRGLRRGRGRQGTMPPSLPLPCPSMGGAPGTSRGRAPSACLKRTFPQLSLGSGSSGTWTGNAHRG